MTDRARGKMAAIRWWALVWALLTLSLAGEAAQGESFCPDVDDFPYEVLVEFRDRIDKGIGTSPDELIRLFEPYEETRQPEILGLLGLNLMYSMVDHDWDRGKSERALRNLNNAAYCGQDYAMELLIGIHENGGRDRMAKPNLAICLRDAVDDLFVELYDPEDNSTWRQRRYEAARRARACGIWPMTDPPTLTDDSPPRP